MRALDRWRIVCAAVLCLTCLCVVGGVSERVVAQSANDSVNDTATETVQHERPESVGESGDLRRLQEWLGGRLGASLESSTIALSQGEYERARAVLGDDYDDRLAQYVDVAGETGDGEDATETYREVRDGQRDLATQVQQFERADERYQQARENGNTTAARRAARRIDRLGSRIEETGGNVTRGYATLANQTDADTSEEQAIVTNVTRDAGERRAEVRDATFVETAVTVIDATRTISFTDPLNVTGRVTTENGTALADRTLTVLVNGRARTTATDAEGQFTLSYRPRTLRLDASAVRLAYVPQNESVYLGSNASVSVDVEQVTPTLTVSDAADETSFGRPTGARVVVAVDGERVNGVPVVVDLGGYRLGRATTNRAGEARVESGLPANVPVGDRQLRASVPLRNRAIGPVNESASVRVTSTVTNLTVAGAQRGGNATVTGQLTTADGRPVTDQSVQITRSGTAVTTVSTGSNGSYAATVPLELDGKSAGDVVQVGVRFDGRGTNLESSRAATALAVGSGTGPSGGGTGLFGIADALPGSSWLVAAVVVLLLAGGGVLAWHRRASDDVETTEMPEPAASQTPAPSPEPVDDEPTPALERAETFLESGAPGAAVRAAYAGIREQYLTDGSSGTHWELVERAQSLADDERTAMEQVVRAYEVVAFSPSEVEAGDASAAITAAREVLDGDGVDVSRDDDSTN